MRRRRHHRHDIINGRAWKSRNRGEGWDNFHPRAFSFLARHKVRDVRPTKPISVPCWRASGDTTARGSWFCPLVTCDTGEALFGVDLAANWLQNFLLPSSYFYLTNFYCFSLSGKSTRVMQIGFCSIWREQIHMQENKRFGYQWLADGWDDENTLTLRICADMTPYLSSRD